VTDGPADVGIELGLEVGVEVAAEVDGIACVGG